MSDARPLVGLDVGSSAVAVVVAVPEGDLLTVRGCGLARHDGARKGVIAKLSEVSEAVRLATEEAEAMASIPVEIAAVGIGGSPILGVQATGSVPVTGKNHTVSAEDQQRALAACAHVDVPPDYHVLEIIPGGYALDGQAGMEHPVGMPGMRLDASAYVLFTHKTHADTVEQAVNQAAVAVDQLIYEPLAAAHAVLTPDERELGCLLIDIGHSSSEWLVFSESTVVASGAVPVGGRHFTSDLAAMLKTTTAAAEQVKRKVGARLDPDDENPDAIEVPTLGGDGQQVRSSSFAAEILYWRAREVLINLHQHLIAGDLERLPRAGLVLTGGGARLDGLVDLAEEIFGYRARIGVPRNLAGISDPVSGPDWAVACGLVRLQHERGPGFTMPHAARGGILTWLRNTLGEFLELGGGT
jgi:cell division protein FtsA